MQHYTLEINGGNMYYADYPGENETIIAIHGLTGNHMQLQYYINALKGDYRVIAVDLKGRGNSVPAETVTGIETHTENIIELIEQLNIKNPIIMGYSMGAFIAANVASRLKKIIGIILLDGAAISDEHQKNIIEPSLGRLSKEYATPEEYIEEIRNIYGRLGVEWTDHLEEIGRYEIKEVNGICRSKSNERKIREDLSSFYEYDPKQVFSKISCPIFLVHSNGNIGTNPPLFLKEHYRDTLVYAKDIYKVTSETNHYTLVFENRPELNSEIKDFLKKL